MKYDKEREKERNRKTESEVQLDLFLSPRELINNTTIRNFRN
jgi:hypothetical protein